jgi:hypothetical protein
LKGGVVHSFDGTAEERDQILALGTALCLNMEKNEKFTNVSFFTAD